jgi:hypothetical protein
MTYACLACEFEADTHLLKLQRLQNKILPTVGKFSRRTPVREVQMAFQVPYIYDYITELCRQQAEVIQNHKNEYVCDTGKGKARYRKYRVSHVKPATCWLIYIFEENETCGTL